MVRTIFWLQALLLGLLQGMLTTCTVEPLIALAFNATFEIPAPPSNSIAVVKADNLAGADIKFYNSSGQELPGKEHFQEGTYNVIILEGDSGYAGMKSVATQGNIDLSVIIQQPGTYLDFAADDSLPVQCQSDTGCNPDHACIRKACYPYYLINDYSTAIALILEAKANALGKSVGSYSGAIIDKAYVDIINNFSVTTSKLYEIRRFISRIVSNGNPNSNGTRMFQSPVLNNQYGVETSPLALGFLTENEVDYNLDGQAEKTTAEFDAVLSAAMLEFDFNVCYNPQKIRVVITVNINTGLKDGNCTEIDPFKWANNKAGAKMFIASAVHQDSPIKDDEIQQILGAGAPNKTPMYDDGTHGDAISGDGIWTVVFDLPIGMRIWYKFTWGFSNDNWGGSEEWPGNSRLLEIIDVNGDHLVVRNDYFGDETTNKDKSNMLLPSNGGTGIVTWDTDANKDGIPDPRERMDDTDGDCILDTWLTPANIEPMTIPCE